MLTPKCLNQALKKLKCGFENDCLSFTDVGKLHEILKKYA